jgi:hypothetical protein
LKSLIISNKLYSFSKNNNFFLNEEIDLIYGLFLDKFNKDDYQILYYKTPSFILPADYDEILNKLFNSHITDDEHEDIYLNKLIACISFGLLEKGINKTSKSTIFNTYDEAKYYQQLFGGKISVLERYQEVVTEPDPLDFGLD